MKLVSWNVNGMRSILGKGLTGFLRAEDADVYCFQETKAREEQVAEVDWPAGYRVFWNAAERPGYSGTAVFTRVPPMAVTCGIGDPTHDREGRVMALEFERFFLVNVYAPNSQRALTRLVYRTQEWEPAFLRHLRGLERRKPVVFCGDMNVAHREIDLARPKDNTRNAGFTPDERACFQQIVDV